MRKLMLMAAALLIGLTACQEKLTDTPIEGEVDVQITAALPNTMGTRSQANPGNGSEVNRCIMEIYKGGQLYGERHVASVSNLGATFSVRLIAGQDYQFVFWADKSGSTINDDLHYNTTNLNTVTIKDLDTYKGNDDTRDAFYALYELTADASKSVEVTLKRPFGQVNVKTLDYTDVLEGSRPTTAKITYKSIYTQFNLFDGSVSNAQAVSYTTATNLMDTNGYLTMDYLFAPTTEDYLIDFSTDYYLNSTLITTNSTTTNIPVRRNYRTNITGNILTKGADLTVVIKPGFDGELYVWDGETTSEPAEVTKTVDGQEVEVYQIENAAELAWVAEQVNARNADVAGKSIDITQDIDLGGHEWTPVGYTGVKNGNHNEGDLYKNYQLFTGSIYGNNHVIKNAVIDKGDDTARALFAQVIGSKENPAVVRDVKAENITIKGDGKWAGAIVGFVRDVKEISGCSAKNVVVESSDNANTYGCGGLIGFISTTDDIVIKNCSVDGVEFTGNRSWNNGGFIGKLVAVKNITIQDCTVAGTMKASLYLGGKLYTGAPTTYIGSDGFQNTWFIGNITLNKDMNMTVTNVTDNSANFTLTDSYGDQGDITDQLAANSFAWPWISVLDGYASTGNATAKITVDGTQLFPKQ